MRPERISEEIRSNPAFARAYVYVVAYSAGRLFRPTVDLGDENGT